MVTFFCATAVLQCLFVCFKFFEKDVYEINHI